MFKVTQNLKVRIEDKCIPVSSHRNVSLYHVISLMYMALMFMVSSLRDEPFSFLIALQTMTCARRECGFSPRISILHSLFCEKVNDG